MSSSSYPYFRQILIDFHVLFSPHLKYVATLPCEILIFSPIAPKMWVLSQHDQPQIQSRTSWCRADHFFSFEVCQEMSAKELTVANHYSRLSCSLQSLIDVILISFSDKMQFTSSIRKYGEWHLV